MKLTKLEAQAKTQAMKSELEWLEDHGLTLHGLLMATIFRMELLRKLIKEEQVKK